jgi:hypothetical protein
VLLMVASLMPLSKACSELRAEALINHVPLAAANIACQPQWRLMLQHGLLRLCNATAKRVC